MNNIFQFRLLLIIGIFGFTFNLAAQGEFMNNSNAIPAMPRPATPAPAINAPSGIYTPNVFSPGKTETKSSGLIEENKMQFEQPEFANPNQSYVDKLNSREDKGDYKQFRKNQYLGDFKSNATAVNISYRDFGEVDGDEIKILVNDQVVVQRVYLGGSYKTLDLPLIKGFNKIDFEALNQGLYGPNTAQFRVYDDKGQLISANQWNLATGFKATIIIFKE